MSECGCPTEFYPDHYTRVLHEPGCALAPLPIPGPPPNTLEDPVVLARKIVAGEEFTDAHAVRVADAYLWLVDDDPNDSRREATC